MKTDVVEAFIPQTKEDEDTLELLELLVKSGNISEDIRKVALAEYRVTKESIGAVLIRNGFISQGDYIEALLKWNPESIYNEEMVTDTIDPTFLISTNTMVVAQHKTTFYVATLFDEEYVRAYLTEQLGRGTIVKFIPLFIDKMDAYLERMKAIQHNDEGLLEKILRLSLRRGFSDIHIHPKISSFSIFVRHLGVRNILYEGTMDEYKTLRTKIKERSSLDTSQTRISQSGAFQIEHNGRYVDLRVESIPLANNLEQVVIRLLDGDQNSPTLASLGVSNINAWFSAVSNPKGIAFICGPTGSGKTTTLQSSIREMDRFGKAIYSVEDPVEYRIPYVAQVNINEVAGMSFSNTTRSFLRADPDVIIIGEIRDEVTARTAIRAAETGHMVIATLHTNDIKGTVKRLEGLGITKNELRGILRTILVQRLVRTVCQSCDGTDRDCVECFGEKYVDRTVVSECEYFKDEDEVDRLFTGEIFWVEMLDDAISKVERGITDADEVIRTFGEPGERRLKEMGVIDG